MSNARSPRFAGGRLHWVGLVGLVTALSICLLPGVADAKKKGKKKKQDTVKVLSYNLYLGSDLAEATNAGLSSRTDLFADEVGEILSDIQKNDFAIRARKIAADIKKHKVDVVGLQEAALWKLEIPTDGGGPPRGTSATTPLIDYIDTLMNELNAKAQSKKQCGKAAKKRKAQGKKPKPCFRGYQLLVAQQQADVEQLGDFDNDPGPNGKTFDVSNSASLGAAAPGRWLEGNDDPPGVTNIGEPPAAQCSDGIDNDGDGDTDYGPVAPDGLATPAGNESSGPTFDPDGGAPGPVGGSPAQGLAPPWGCDSRVDNNEAANPPTTDPNGLPQDANFDHHVAAGNGASPQDGTPTCGAPGPTCPGKSYDSVGNGLDAAGITDAPDNSTDDGPEDATPGWPYPNLGYAENTVPVSMFHGIDGDIRLQMRDAIVVRKGAGVKSSNVTGGNFSPASTFKVTVFGTALNFTRGWTAADLKVRGKKFRLVNTHLESESVGSVREDQASELIAPGGPASVPNTVLIGDLNSDPNRAPTGLPDNDGGSNIAINRLLAGGFTPVEVPGFSGGHGELLSDLGNTLADGRIDHILTNGSSIRLRSGTILDGQIGGLWASDHGGVLSRLAIPGGKKKGGKKKK